MGHPHIKYLPTKKYMYIQIKRPEAGEVIMSYDVKALFTSEPVDPSIHIVQHKFSQDPTLHQRTSMSIQNIVTFLELSLKKLTSSSKVSIMNRYVVLPWAPPISPLIADLFMEEFKV